MKLDTLEISRDDAKAKVDEYAALRYEERTAEDDAILRGYRAAARGLPIISLQRAIETGGYFANGLPKIAIIRADAEQCFAWRDGQSILFADREGWQVNRGALVGAHSVRVPVQDRPHNGPGYWKAGQTTVPLVPPSCRPHRLRWRSTHHILWEVEAWTRIPPKDPALLRHIRGDLWAVISMWDLTELERSVLAQRAT